MDFGNAKAKKTDPEAELYRGTETHKTSSAERANPSQPHGGASTTFGLE